MDEEKKFDLTEDEKEEVYQALAEFDTENTGTTTFEGMRLAFESLGLLPTEADFYQMWDLVNPDRYSSILYQEVMPLMHRYYYGLHNMKTLKAVFDYVDSDSLGFINKSELRNVMISMGENMSDKAYDDFFAAVDGDLDGKITWDEFLRLVA